ncbi:septal ring lytic transglycosylase RlpA family protein [Amorphus sp. 3PC139-8]|uniref:septal ring lytic transglycosylase RlpA family protein n=1 Tax=Amorphus sp. 3PC139-8 TaxID=2735676 RepID=UPI00345E0576
MTVIRNKELGAAAPAVDARQIKRKVALPSNTLFRFGVVIAGCVALAACNSTSGDRAEIDPKYGVPPSPRVIGSGKPIPKGGGREMVGKPYKVAGRWYKPKLDPNYEAVGTASWYGAAFHGRMTANGEVFDANSFSAAHTTMPLPSYARVTNLKNGRSIIVRVNDRGPFHGSRVIDVSHRTADVLDFRNDGVAKVKVEYVGPARLDGHDQDYLLASYRGPSSGKPPATRPKPEAPERSILLASKSKPQKNTSERVTPNRSRDTANSATSALLAYVEDNPRPRHPIPSRDGPPPVATSSKPSKRTAEKAPEPASRDEALPGVAASESSASAPAPTATPTAPEPERKPDNDPMAQLVEIASNEDAASPAATQPEAAPVQLASADSDPDPIGSRIMAAYATMGTGAGGLDAGAIAMAASKSGSGSAATE